MRLTLRTLLAYVDDRLSPANAREIGQKITNSPFATDLMERIRDVKRRRRLADPEKPQPMIEANLIAEYLDDQLTPELVARVEREILASDSMLAEVAAAHEILGLLRDPVSVEPRLRDRLYALDPTGKLEAVRAISGEPLPAAPLPPAVAPWKPLQAPTVASKRVPMIVVGTLALVWLMVLASDSNLFRTPVANRNDAVNRDAEVVDQAPPEEAVADDNAEKAGNKLAQADNNEAQQGNSAPDDLKGIDAAVAVVAETDKPVLEKPAEDMVEPELIVAATPESKEPMKEIKPVPEAPESPAPATEPATADHDGGIPSSYFLQADPRSVLLLDEKMQRWFTLADIPGGEVVESAPNNVDCGAIVGQRWFGVAEPFQLQIVSGSKGYQTTALGPCLVRFQAPSSSGLDLLSGRLKLAADRNVAWDAENRPVFQLGIGEKSASMTLESQDSRIAIEVMPVGVPTTASTEAGRASAKQTGLPFDADLMVAITALEGSVVLRVPDQAEEVVLAKGQRAIWTMLEMKSVALFAVDNGVPVASAPAWLFEQEHEPVPEVQKQNEALLTALEKTGEPGDCVLPLLEDRNPQSGILAVRILTLTRDANRLLSILFEPRDETIHRAAIDGLTSIANSSLVAAESIRAGLETRLPEAESDLMMPLLLGLNDAQAADPVVAAELMGMLNSERLATRTLAIYRMEQRTKDRRGYHPESELSRRREAIRRWQRYFEQNSGVLVP